MIIIKHDVRPEEIRQSARHILFVEGNDKNSVDPKVLSGLLQNIIRVEPLGASFHIRSAAQAFYKYHPDYYFLIDRDHHESSFIKKCWDNFPDPTTDNLLIWPRREIENYFLIPEYLMNSSYLNVSEDVLKACIIKECKRRLYLDAVNQVIITIREDLKENWISTFKDIAGFGTKKSAIAKLIQASEFISYKKKVSSKVTKNALENRFNKIFNEFTDGKDEIEYGCGIAGDCVSKVA